MNPPATPHDLPKGWKYEGAVMISHPTHGSVQAVCAVRSYPSDDGGSVTITVHARSLEAIVAKAVATDSQYLRPGPEATEVLISREELFRVLGDNRHLRRQVTELQQGTTLKEEQLRAHRRVSLTDDQSSSLKRDLEETTNSVLKKYAPQTDPPPPPKMKSGEFLVVCPSCTDRAKTSAGG